MRERLIAITAALVVVVVVFAAGLALGTTGIAGVHRG
jgi:hypothetical protein